MKVWFMFDNHTFALVGDGTTPAAALDARLRELWSRDGSGLAFARDGNDRAMAFDCYREADIPRFIAAIEDFSNWEARG